MRARVSRAAEIGALVLGSAGIALLTVAYVVWLGITNHTTVALSFLLVVLLVASSSTRRVAIAMSLTAFACFNFFFLPPVQTFTIADPDNWVALFALLAVSIVASHLSAQVRRRAEEAAQLLEERHEAEIAQRAAELRSTLLASLSHDLKTPLTALTVAANNLDAPWLTAEQRREQAEIVRSELNRLDRLFQGIFDMARIETHAVSVEREWVTPAEIVEAAARHAERALAGHSLEVHPDADRILVRLDPRLTSAALAHLLENAGQYSPPGSAITVDVSLASGELRIAIRDRGPGIPADEADRLFEPFYRGVGARRQRPGSGMGLAITRGLLAAEGGRVQAENAPQRGAVFTIAVPADSQPAAAVEGEAL